MTAPLAPATIHLGIASRGHLHAGSVQLLERAVGLRRTSSQSVFMDTAVANLRVVCLRPNDVARLLAEDVLQLGITGNLNVMEAGVHVEECADLGICAGDLAVLVANDDPAASLDDLPADVSIATQYPRSAQRLLCGRLPALSVRRVDGAAEAFPALGLARAIVDVVATGRSARENGLRAIATLARVTARIYAGATATPAARQLVPMLSGGRSTER